jgi:hypothetical protein
MRLGIGVLVAGGLALLTATPAEADVYVRAPFVRVHVGSGGPPPVYLPPAPVVVAPRPVVVQPPVVVPQPGTVVVYEHPMTHPEFARVFRPAQGTYEAVLIHPDTCLPVRVCFTLPCGCPKKVRVERHELEFDYGDREVEIRFKRDGRVKVEYND